MSILDKLSDKPILHSSYDMVKWADVSLGDNPQLWFAKIYGAFEGQHPEALRPNSAPSLTFDKQDFVSGYALGAIRVAAGPNLMVFPVIVRDKKLAPFDLVFVNGNLRYAEKSMIRALANPYQPFVGISSSEVGKGPATEDALHTNSPNSGRLVMGQDNTIDVMADLEARIRPVCYALEVERLNKTASSIRFEDIKHTITQDQIYKWAQVAVEDPDYYVNSTSQFRNMFEALSQESVKQASVIEDWHDIAMVEKQDIDRYSVKFAKRGYDGVVRSLMDSAEIRKLAGQFDQNGNSVLDLADKLYTNGGGVLLDKTSSAIQDFSGTLEKAASMGQPLADYMVNGKVPTFEIPGLIHNYGTYNVLLTTGEYDTGVVFNLVDWNFKKEDNKLFVGRKYAIQDRMAGQASSTSCRAPRGEPTEGTTGTYVYEHAGTGFAVPPFEILSHRTTPRGIAIKAQSIMDGKPLNLVPVDGIKSLVKITQENDPEVYIDGCVNVYVPTSMQFIVLPPERDVIIPDPQQAIKLSSWKQLMTMGPSAQVRIIAEPDNHYQLDMVTFPLHRMPEHIRKLSNFSPVDRRASKTVDVVLGLKVAGIESLYELVGLKSGYTHTLTIPLKTASEISGPLQAKDYSAVWYEIHDRIPHSALYKIASMMEEEKTLNEVFSLNFINKDNMQYFMSNLGMLRDVEEYLARLLLAARIADVGIEEGEIGGALEDVVHIKEILSRKQILAGE